ncbi:Ig-like domain-containing protein [Pantoea dispersa]|uniref:Ig-like domain-containing protein n=1 Tax=Pantoea dispersa TaxID=59814 RepID=UPI0021C9E785|nr:Ig-like domain-containing protein [Pantoea dispersa]UXO68981.1 Ig-like domain-containing protein [Pantoea dispersa]
MSTALTNAKQLWTTDPQRTFSGSAPTEAGGIMEIVMDSTVYTVTIAADGSWSWQPPFPLAEGPHNLSVRTIDRAGNVGAPSLFIVNVDLTAPDQPLIIGVDDNAGDKTGPVSSGQQTDDRTPTLKGVAEPDSIVRLYNAQNQLIGSVKASSNGYWEITPTLADGEHSLYVTATDGRGYVSQPSEAFTLTVADDSAVPVPGKVEITHAQDNAGAAQGKLLDGALTDDTTPTLRGTAPAGSNVLIQYRDVNGLWVDGGYATLSGTEWSWTPDKALGEGNWEFRANAGNGWTDEFTLEIDLTPQSELSITHAWDDFGINTGLLHSGAITDDRTPALNGRAEANSIVYLHFRNVLGNWELLGSVQAGADGNWVYETDRISPGSYQFSASISDSSHNTRSNFPLTIVNEKGWAPQILSAYDDAGKLTGNIKSGGSTDDNTPEIHGSAEANSLVMIEYRTIGGEWVNGSSVKADASGFWSFTPPPLKVGTWEFIAKNSSQDSTSNHYVLGVRPDITGQNFTENFNEAKTGSISGGKFDINGATIYYEGAPCSIQNTFNSRHIVLGKSGTSVTGKLSIDLDYYASDISFDAMGAENSTNPIKIQVFNQHGEIIHSATINQYSWKKFSYKAPVDQLISKVDISVVNEHAGFDIDNISYTASHYKDIVIDTVDTMKTNDDSEKASTHNDLPSSFTRLEFNDGEININVNDILKNATSEIFINNSHSQVMINGSEKTEVKLECLINDNDFESWTQQTGTVTIAGVQYEVYSHNGSDAELLVQEGVKVELI